MLDDDPDTVYRISDLLVVTIRRNGEKWMTDVLNELVKTINEIAISVLQKQLSQCEAPANFPQIPASLLNSLKEAGFDPAEVEKDSKKLSTALLLLTLLFDEARMSCAQAIDEGKLMETIIQLLSVSQERCEIESTCKSVMH